MTAGPCWGPPFFVSVLLACSDPPDPPPAPAPEGVPRWSTAPYVNWAGPMDRTGRPLAVFEDSAGGPLDRLVADPDASTFLNDRFEAWFLDPKAAQGLPEAPAAWFLDTRGCLVSAPWNPPSAGAWIARANEVLVELSDESKDRAAGYRPEAWTFDLPADHPLRGTCTGSHSSQEASPGTLR